MSMTLRQRVKIVPVEHWLEGIAMAKAAMAAQNQDRAFHSVRLVSFVGAGWFFILEESGECTRLS